MIAFFLKHKKTIFLITVIVFVVSIFFGLGAYVGIISLGDTVAKVGSRKIGWKHYQRMFSIAMDRVLKEHKELQGEEAYKVVEKMVKDEVFKEMIVDEILRMEAEKFDFRISDFEVALEIRNTPAFLLDGRFDARAYVSSIWSKYRMTPAEYEDWRRNQRLSGRFKSFLLEAVKVTPDELEFYRQFIKDKSIKDNNKFAAAVKQQKFIDIANNYLRSVISKLEVQDFRKKFENRENI
ncbi:MAG: SurA N-terminal domain-containing protein [Elusimicrobiales bacterium]